MSFFSLTRKSDACSGRAPSNPKKSKNNFSLRGYCLLASEDFSPYINESIGLVTETCLPCISDVIYVLYWRMGGNKGTILTRVRWNMAEFSDESIKRSSVKIDY